MKVALALILAASTLATVAQTPSPEWNVPKPGVKEVQVSFASLKPSATINIGGTADWALVTDDAAWVASTKPYAVVRIDPSTNKILATIKVPGEACSGLASGFGSIWVPLCGKKSSLVRVDATKNLISVTLPIPPAGPEGGITVSEDSVWIVSDKNGTLNRIDPSTNNVRQKISIPPGSYNPLFSNGIVWITGVESSVLTAVEASTGKVLESMPVPRNAPAPLKSESQTHKRTRRLPTRAQIPALSMALHCSECGPNKGRVAGSLPLGLRVPACRGFRTSWVWVLPFFQAGGPAFRQAGRGRTPDLISLTGTQYVTTSTPACGRYTLFDPKFGGGPRSVTATATLPTYSAATNSTVMQSQTIVATADKVNGIQPDDNLFSVNAGLEAQYRDIGRLNFTFAPATPPPPPPRFAFAQRCHGRYGRRYCEARKCQR